MGAYGGGCIRRKVYDLRQGLDLGYCRYKVFPRSWRMRADLVPKRSWISYGAMFPTKELCWSYVPFCSRKLQVRTLAECMCNFENVRKRTPGGGEVSSAIPLISDLDIGLGALAATSPRHQARQIAAGIHPIVPQLWSGGRLSNAMPASTQNDNSSFVTCVVIMIHTCVLRRYAVLTPKCAVRGRAELMTAMPGSPLHDPSIP